MDYNVYANHGVYHTVLKNLEAEIVNILNKLQQISGLPNDQTDPIEKVPIKKRTKDLHQGDLVIPAGCVRILTKSTSHDKLLSLMKDYCSREKTLTVSVSCDQHSLLSFHLDRPKFVGLVVKEILNRGRKYGCSCQPDANVIFLHATTSKSAANLMDLRLAVLKNHAKKLLEANGYTVVNSSESSEDFESLLSDGSLPVKEKLDSSVTSSQTGDTSWRQDLVSSLQSLYTLKEAESNDPEKHYELDPSDQTSVKDLNANDFFYLKDKTLCVDLQQVISSKCLCQGKGGFDSNLKTAAVLQMGKPTQVLEDCLNIAQAFSTFPPTCKHGFVHITPSNAAFSDQQRILVLKSLTEASLAQSQMSVGQVYVKEASKEENTSAAVFYRTRFDQFKEASEMRNGVSNDVLGVEDIQTLTLASIKIDILGNASNSPLTLENSASDRGAESRLGAFILYNTARLSTLLKRFELAVTEGTYPELPPVDQIDWTLLREEEDWELVFVHLAAFPDVVSQSVQHVFPTDGKLTAQIHTHKVTNFLVTFCKCLSAHYSRYHILTGSEAHLLPLMFARLYMMKAAYQVLLNCLQLIGVNPLSYV